jgi:hypothetical protein
LKDGAELCCTKCDPDGLPYHEECWQEEELHVPSLPAAHRKSPISYIGRIRDLNEPNKWKAIEDDMFKQDLSNIFIEFDVDSHKFQFGHRAFPLLRNKRDEGTNRAQYPSFVSFVGRTMNGKSFLIRALQHGGAVDRFPTPIPAPGSKQHNHDSTSSDIHIYADWKTTADECPILFLDCEGFEGSDMPSSHRLKPRLSAIDAQVRREFVHVVYPRLVYTFSTCIVFVTSGPLAEAADIGRRLISYASQGARGSQSQGFKPSLFVVFNRFRDMPGFDWSIESSTKAFLAHEGLDELRHFYDTIRVVCIPSVCERESDVALQQIDALRECLRKVHEETFRSRKEFRLDFTPSQLTSFMWKALDLFSKDRNSVFDWSVQAGQALFEPDGFLAPFHDLWTKCVKHHEKTRASMHSVYNLARTTFEKHVKFCLRLSLARKPPPGVHFETIPQSLDEPIAQTDAVLLQYAPCGALSSSGVKCQEVRFRHADYHQGTAAQDPGVCRWPGRNEGTPQPFREVFEATLKTEGMTNVSLRGLGMSS